MEKVPLAKNFILKELLEVFYKIKSAKDKMLQVASNFERSMTIC